MSKLKRVLKDPNGDNFGIPACAIIKDGYITWSGQPNRPCKLPQWAKEQLKSPPSKSEKDRIKQCNDD